LIAKRVIKVCFSALLCTGLAQAWAQNVPAAQNTKPAAQAISNAEWQKLSASQKTALAPLSSLWTQISPAQKSKWLAISNNFDKLSVKEQAVLHERMANWAALSPQQRAQARLTFNETKSLGSDEKKTHWEAYQALSADEKKKLAAQQKTGIQGAATASQAPPPGKVIRLPGKSTPTPAPSKSSPGIVIDKKTLLPTPVAIPEGT
jgi:hypothetical protein